MSRVFLSRAVGVRSLANISASLAVVGFLLPMPKCISDPRPPDDAECSPWDPEPNAECEELYGAAGQTCSGGRISFYQWTCNDSFKCASEEISSSTCESFQCNPDNSDFCLPPAQGCGPNGECDPVVPGEGYCVGDDLYLTATECSVNDQCVAVDVDVSECDPQCTSESSACDPCAGCEGGGGPCNEACVCALVNRGGHPSDPDCCTQEFIDENGGGVMCDSNRCDSNYCEVFAWRVP